MSEVHVKEGESLDSALKRFKRSCAKAGVLAEVRKRECYESPSVKRRKKSEAARKNRNKRYYVQCVQLDKFSSSVGRSGGTAFGQKLSAIAPNRQPFPVKRNWVRSSTSGNITNPSRMPSTCPISIFRFSVPASSKRTKCVWPPRR